MSFTNSFAIIRTHQNAGVKCYTVFTHRYATENKDQFVYNGYPCTEFQIEETVGGDVVVTTFDTMGYSKVRITNTIRFRNVSGIEILTSHAA